MVATNRFKKDFGYYLLGIIVPGLLNAALIPIIKHLLGTSIFGGYSLKFNFLLLLMATLIGGICQSIIRFKVYAENNLPSFYAQVFTLIRNLLIPVAIICFLLFFLYFHQTLLLSLLFSFCVIGGCLQNILMAFSQANFHSKFIMLSEGIRAFAFFAFAIIALSVIKSYQQEMLFLSLLLSYLVSIFVLASKNKLSFTYIIGIKKTNNNAFTTKTFLIYGFPLSLLLVVYYLFTYLDKPLLAHDFGLEIQGNYQAMFDIIFRGITGIMSPFSIAVLPVLSQAIVSGDIGKGIALLSKLIWVQIVLTFIGAIFYWFVGFNILAKILTVPITIDYKVAGLIMIFACMVWQIGLLQQKPYEIAKKTGVLLKFIMIALASYVILFIIIRSLRHIVFFEYTLPFLISGITYNLLCIIGKKSNKHILNFYGNGI